MNSPDPFRLADLPPASARALPYRSVIERMEIVRVVAETDLGIDYLAIDHATRAEVLLKEYLPARLAHRQGGIVRSRTTADASAFALGLRAFLSEGHLLAHATHPALVHVSNVIEANGTAYQVMARHYGTRLLRARQQMDGAPDEPALRALLDGLLGALDVLHQSGAVHGAVAPANVLLQADEQPLLLGPDLARAQISSGLVESLMATVEPSFVAPEQRWPSEIDSIGPWTDLYSLAETVRFCISGEPPPPAAKPPGRGQRESMIALVWRLFGDDPTEHYGRALLDTLDAALRTSAAERPQSVAEFRAALRAPPVLGVAPQPRARLEPAFDVDIKLPPPPAVPTSDVPGAVHAAMQPPRTRERTLWAGGALVLLLGAGTYGWWRTDQPLRLEMPRSVVSTVAPDAPVPTVTPRPASIAELQPAPTPTPAAPHLPVAPSAALAPLPLPLPPPARPPAPAPRVVASKAAPASPRDACAGRTQFAFYRCMQAQCEQRGWAHHPQCERLKSTDDVD